MDVKDAFLLVPQREKILVEKPSRWSDNSNTRTGCWRGVYLDSATLLLASLIFFVIIFKLLGWRTHHCCQVFSSTRRRTSHCVLTWMTRVVGGERGAVEWLVSALKSKLTLQGGELIPAWSRPCALPEEASHRQLVFMRSMQMAGAFVWPTASKGQVNSGHQHRDL